MSEPPYILDFLQQITAVHWGTPVYLVISASGANEVVTTFQASPPDVPPTPTFAVTPLNGAKSLDKQLIPNVINDTADFWYVYPPFQFGAAAGGFTPTVPPEPIGGNLGYKSLEDALTYSHQTLGPGGADSGPAPYDQGTGFCFSVNLNPVFNAWALREIDRAQPIVYLTDSTAAAYVNQCEAQAYAEGNGIQYFANVISERRSNYNFQRGATLNQLLKVNADGKSCATLNISQTGIGPDFEFATATIDLYATNGKGGPISQNITHLSQLTWSPDAEVAVNVRPSLNGSFTFAVEKVKGVWKILAPAPFH